MDKYKIQPIPKEQAKEWFLCKHYAKRIPPTIYCFGLYLGKELVGVCSFGMPCMQMNDGNCIFNTYKVRTLELNRLIVNDGLGKNVLSYFLSKCIKELPKPLCLVSFADPNNGHNGYIYQATNWLYTGISEKGGKNKNFRLNGHNYHGSTVTAEYIKTQFGRYDSSKTVYENWEEIGGEVEDFGQKHRYLMFLGSKKEIKDMKKDTVYRFLPYPKGENRRYDASYKPVTTNSLF